MKEQNQHTVPDYVFNALNAEKPLSSEDISDMEKILEHSGSFAYPESNVNQKWQSFLAGIEKNEPKPKTRHFEMFKWASAAIIVLTIGIGFLMYNTGEKTFSQHYKTEQGRLKITLPEGSTIYLNRYTELDVVSVNSKERKITMLSGEAYFKVSHNNLPFTVNTLKGVVNVTGTEFNIKSRKNLPFYVCLDEGSISFNDRQGNVLNLKAGEKIYSNTSGALLRSIDTSSSGTTWMDNKYVFNDKPLAEIIKELEYQYNVKFIYDERLANEKYTISFENMNVNQVAQLLSKTIDSEVLIK